MNADNIDEELLEMLCNGKQIKIDQAYSLKKNYQKYKSAYIKQNVQEENHGEPSKKDENDESLKIDKPGEPLKMEKFALKQFLNALPQILIYLLDLSNKAAFDKIFNGYMVIYVIALMLFFYLLSYSIYIFVNEKTKIKSVIGAVFTTTIIVGNVFGEIITKVIYKEEESYKQMGVSRSIQCGIYIFCFFCALIYETKCCTRQGSTYIRDINY